MAKLSQKRIIELFLAEVDDWYPGYKLRSFNTDYGWVGSSGDRRIREMHTAGTIERKLIGKYVHYRINRIREPVQGTIPINVPRVFR